MKLILSGITAYISTNIDYLLVLMLIFHKSKSKKDNVSIYLGNLIGIAVLVGSSLILAFILKLVPEKWILGMLGLIPIYMGIKLLVVGEADDDKNINNTLKRNTNLISSVAMITIATCGADNIGIYIPYFVTLSWANIMVVMLVFLVMLTIIFFVGYNLVKLPIIEKLLEKHGTWMTAIVYVLLGIYILFENGTIQKFLN